ncbi:tetratricopeptide repeat protein [Lentzea terrae]|uniref:tetratricopeptide repeat protein n=1 Tax=Lentzea terrae TaxID=2200761 RepID=UPI0013003860|nr:transcriptional regulator [Lentzea terrae]
MAAPHLLPAPLSIGASDVARMESDTHALRALDYRHGGEACLDAVRLRVRECEETAEASATPVVRQRLHVALADLHNLAGWVCFDAGLAGSARGHFRHALVLAGRGRHSGLIANICYRLGRVCLHQGNLDDALGYFELGQRDVTRPGDEIGASILSMNAAWAHAKQGDEDMACVLLNRGKEHFAAAGDTPVPEWAKFFTENDLSALAGAVHTDLARTANPRHTRIAIPLLTRAIGGYGDAMARSRAFSHILLAINHLVEGNIDGAVDIGFRAMASTEDIGSARVRDRLRPLGLLARRHGSHAGARELSARIAGIAAPVKQFSRTARSLPPGS